jgi:hypothetical protein
MAKINIGLLLATLINFTRRFYMKQTYLTTDELSIRIKYDPRTIRDQLKDSVLLEGRHYFRPFGGRKILYIWEVIEDDMIKSISSSANQIPMARGGTAHV